MGETRADVTSSRGSGRFGRIGPIRGVLILMQVLTVVGFFIILGGLSALQHKANNLGLAAGLAAQTPAAVTLAAGYTQVFDNAHQVPYPANPSWQFAFQWFILFLELAVLVCICVLATFPATILRLKHVAIGILVYVWVLITLNVESVLYYHRNAAANEVYGAKNIKVTLAGLIMVATTNGFTVMCLGLVGTGSDFIPTHQNVDWSRGGNKVAASNGSPNDNNYDGDAV